MGKGDKNANAAKKITNKHLHARISYLYQAAHLLDTITRKDAASVRHVTIAGDQQKPKDERATVTASSSNKLSFPLSQRLASQIRPVARKAVIKVAPSIKRTICKRCNVLLVPGNSCEVRMENQSRDQSKAWADIQIIRCNTCGFEKRIPVGAKPQVKKANRPAPVALPT